MDRTRLGVPITDQPGPGPGKDIVGNMRTIPILLLCSLWLLAVARLGTGVVLADNIALGKPYEWSPRPDYDLCTDEGDTVQLTDGISKGADWTVASTVGWVHKGRVTLTVDLGSVQSIGRVAFVAAGGGLADVFFPAVTAVLTSADGQTWYTASAIGSGTRVQDRSKAYSHKFETKDLTAQGRYVRLVFQAEERYLFLDEVEVYAAEVASPPGGEPTTEDALDTLLARGLTARWVAGEWRHFREQTVALAESAGPAAPPGIPPRIEAIDARAARLDVSDPDAVEALRLAYTRLRAEAARARHGAGVHIQRVDPWADHRGATFPPALQALPPELDLLTWQDEYETAAWSLTNLDDRKERVRITVSPFQDGKGQDLPLTGRLWLRRGLAVPTRVGHRVVDALPLLVAGDQDAEVVIEAGEYRLLWLTVRARDLPPGAYRACVRVTAAASGDALLEAPLTLTVAPLRMPPADERALSGCAWDEYLLRWDRPREAADNLRAYGVNTFILHPIALPRPKFDPGRTRLVSVDFEPLDAALARRGGCARMHGVFWGGNPSFWGLDLKDPGHAELFKQFIRSWAEHLGRKGIGPDRFFFYPLDEETSERLLRLGALIKEANPRFQLYWNQINVPGVDPDLMRRVAPYVDIACLKISTLAEHDDTSRQEAAFRQIRREHQPDVWTYACKGPGRLMPPDTYYRNLSWETFRRGATGTGFWCYADGNGWDPYAGNIQYGVVYSAKDAPPHVTRAEPIIPSRRWEAFREGTEDFEYLHQTQQAIATAREAGADPSACDRAEAVLSTAVSSVLNSADDPGRYQRARRSLTEVVLQLRRTTGGREGIER